MGEAEGPVNVFVDLPQGGATLAGTPWSQNLVPAALLAGGLKTGNGGAESRWVVPGDRGGWEAHLEELQEDTLWGWLG